MVGKSTKKEDSSPKREPKRTYRKSPARTEAPPKSPSRSTARKTNVSPSPRPAIRKSPSRTTQKSTTSKSPSRRSPSRKSPSRKSPSRKSPSRKSPSRLAKDNDTSVPERPKRISRAQATTFINFESDSEDSDTNLYTNLSSEKPKAAVRGSARRTIIETSKRLPAGRDITPAQEMETYIGVTRRSLSKSQSKEIDHIDRIKRETLISSIQKLTELSDEDEVKSPVKEDKLERRSVSRLSEKKEIVSESGWIVPLLLIFALPSVPIVYYAFCNEVQCQLMKLPNLSKFKNLGIYFDGMSFGICSGFGLLVALLSAVPFGGRKISGLPNKQGKLDYVMNGGFVGICACLALAILEFYKVPVIENIMTKYFQLHISLVLLGIILSIWFYIRSFYVPLCSLKSDVLTNTKIYNFVNGRELNPRVFGVDVKMCLSRFVIIGSILLNAIFIYKDIEIGRTKEGGALDLKSTKYNLTLIIAALTQIFYLSDTFIFESSLVTSSTVQYDAVGYQMSLLSTYGVVMMNVGPKYIYDYKVQLPTWQLIIILVVFWTGLFLYRSSNQQKHAFRQNPYHPSVSHLESIPTSQGKKLLVSGYWGFVRHPNYLGDILMYISFILSVNYALPAVLYGLVIFSLVQRAQEDGIRCKQRYGSAWTRYCERVKYVLIPKLY